MPEGDTVHRLAQRLQPLEGRTITHSDFRVPSLATLDLRGRTIERVWAWGKNLYWRCSGVDDDLVVHTHLKMEGTWRLHPAGSRWRLPAHSARVVVRVSGSPDRSAEVEVVGHWLGRVEVFPAAEFARRTAHLGPDPLDPDWDHPGRWPHPGREEATLRLAAARDAGRTIGEALLDQSIMAGVGNEYRNEVCFLLGLHPAAPASRAEPAQVTELVGRVMHAAQRGPLRVFTGIDHPGETSFVFGRNHKPCRRCGTPIRSGSLGGASSVADPEVDRERVIWWCPTCQPEPAG